MDHKKFPVSWDQIHKDTRELARQLITKGQWDGIVAVTRGGLIPACIIARELNIRLIETYCIASYRGEAGQDQGQAKTIKNTDIPNQGKNWLVIDDLVDSGKTFIEIQHSLPNAHYACVYAKPQGIPTTHSYVTEVPQDTWVYFPWDMEIQYSKPYVGDDD
jgi:xanthine phosphoribosyltransferase